MNFNKLTGSCYSHVNLNTYNVLRVQFISVSLRYNKWVSNVENEIPVYIIFSAVHAVNACIKCILHGVDES